MATNNPDDCVMGVVFEIVDSEKWHLDLKEGLGMGYHEKNVTVSANDGKSWNVLMYYAVEIDASLKPYHWYKQHVLVGAHEHNLPAEYTRVIEAVPALDDPNRARHELELSIYRS